MSVSEELDRMLREAQEKRTYGQIQIDLQDGKPVLIRQTVTRKLDTEDNRSDCRRRVR